jgi:hypothetical protein
MIPREISVTECPPSEINVVAGPRFALGPSAEWAKFKDPRILLCPSGNRRQFAFGEAAVRRHHKSPLFYPGRFLKKKGGGGRVEMRRPSRGLQGNEDSICQFSI